MSEGCIATFYSYKGGVGRTLALASVGALLSMWGYRVLCIDWDLEAPGLHLYYERWIERRNGPGLVELIQDWVDGRHPHWRGFVTRLNFPGSPEPLLLMPAGIQNDSYIRRMQALDWKALYDDQGLGNYLETLRQEWKQEFDVVLIDSRTGITDIGGICTIQIPDVLVLLFTANAQSLYGAVDVANRATQQRNLFPFDRAKLLVLPMVTRFESRIEYELAQEWLETFAVILAPLYAEWSHRDVTAAQLLNFTKLPYVPYWSFGERVPVLEEGTRDPESLGYALETLTAMIAHRLAWSDLLTSNRDSYVDTARRRPSRPGVPATKTGIELFFSYSFRDEPLRDRLAKHLDVLKQGGIIESWSDRQIGAGSEVLQVIDPRLETADIILLLVSADYLASEIIYNVEIPRALERRQTGEAIVLPVILRPVDWSDTPFSQIPALPVGGKAVATWPEPDEAFVSISRGIRTAVERLNRSRARSTQGEATNLEEESPSFPS